jgi:hypothetical protein
LRTRRDGREGLHLPELVGSAVPEARLGRGRVGVHDGHDLDLGLAAVREENGVLLEPLEEGRGVRLAVERGLLHVLVLEHERELVRLPVVPGQASDRASARERRRASERAGRAREPLLRSASRAYWVTVAA